MVFAGEIFKDRKVWDMMAGIDFTDMPKRNKNKIFCFYDIFAV